MILSKTVPIFSSHHSFNSILTLESPTKKNDKGEEIPNESSIFYLADKYNISPIFILEKEPSGFLEAIVNAKELNKQIVLGIKLFVVTDMLDKSEKSLDCQSKINIFAKNSQGYEDLLQIYNLAASEGKYYKPRIDWDNLRRLWTDNLILVIPFYDSFLYRNFLEGKNCLYSPPTQAIFLEENNNLPFDSVLSEKLKETARIILPAKSIHYEKKDDFLSYLAYKCITERKGTGTKTLIKPNLDHMSSEEFCLEAL